jgi:hypothetical protein
MTVTTSPSDEACHAIVDRINTGTGYSLPSAATYSYQLNETLESSSRLQIDVIHIEQETLVETLDTEDRTSHQIEVWIRKQLRAGTAEEISELNLIARKIFQRINNYTGSRVKVWDCDFNSQQMPEKQKLRESLLYSATIPVRVEVEAS